MQSAFVKSIYGLHGNQSALTCENCAKTPEKIGVNTKFLVCSVCKTKVGSAVYYCSQWAPIIISSEHSLIRILERVRRQIGESTSRIVARQ
jgi:hypothetical protein